MSNPIRTRSRRPSQRGEVVRLPSRAERGQTPQQGALVGVLTRLAALREGLSPTARRIAEFVLANAADVVDMSVTEIAERTQSSEGSVVGLCQQLGARGFQQVKIAIARDLVKPVQFIHEDLGQG